MAEVRRSQVTVMFLEKLVSDSKAGEFYYSMRPYVTRHDYKPTSDQAVATAIVKELGKKFKAKPIKVKG